MLEGLRVKGLRLCKNQDNSNPWPPFCIGSRSDNAQLLISLFKPSTMTDWNKLKVVDLKNELKRRGLPQIGLKPALVARLEAAAENEDGSESEATVQGDAGKVNADSATSPDTASPTQTTTSDPTQDVSPVLKTNQPLAEPESAPEKASEPFNATQDPSTEALHTGAIPLLQPIHTTEFSQPPSASEPTDGGDRSAALSVEPREALEDRQKRKRRSQSPVPSSAEITRKRIRPDDGLAEETPTSSEDTRAVEQDANNRMEVEEESMVVPTPGDDSAKEEMKVDDTTSPVLAEDKMEVDAHDNPQTEGASPESRRDSRFKNLFKSPPQPKASEDTDMGLALPERDAEEPERSISPATHPATSALYIRDFMRPLNPAQLKTYLTSLATPPGEEPDPEVILNFYLDPIRSHSFVAFQNISAAARVRNAIHERIWPDERTRKPLWADFVPADKVEEWIAEEESKNTGGRGAARKWEVYYHVDSERQVTATLQESTGGSMAGLAPSRKVSLVNATPVGGGQFHIKGVAGAPSGPRADQAAPKPGENLSTLNELFKSTTTQPTLYYLPVSKSLANKRLDHIDDAASKDYSQRTGGGDIHRYTFEDGDVLVDRGPEIFSGIRPPPGHRGPRGNVPRGGGYRGPDRGYDSYRGGRDSREDSYRGGRDSRDDGYRRGRDPRDRR